MSEQANAFKAKREEIKASKPKPYEKKEVKYSEKNYLDTRIYQGDKKELQFRLIPLSNESDEMFEEVYFHWDNKIKKSFVCAKHTKNLPEGIERECPYCDIEEGYWAEYRVEVNRIEKPKNINEIKKDVIYKNEAKIKDIKDSALLYKAQPNNVLRGIERVSTKDGIVNEQKFWKVAEKVLDNIETVQDQHLKYNIDIFDTKTGKDLLINYVLEKKKSKYSSLSADMVQTPVSEDEAEIKAFIENDLKWYDVYTIKSYEYLDLIINGKTPWFDKPSNKWIDKATLNNAKVEEIPNNEEEVEEDVVEEEIKGDNGKESDDLPF